MVKNGAENDTNLFIEILTLRDALRFRICIEKYPLSQINFFWTNYFCVLCEKKNSEKILGFGHILEVLLVHTCTGNQATKVQTSFTFKLKIIKVQLRPYTTVK